LPTVLKPPILKLTHTALEAAMPKARDNSKNELKKLRDLFGLTQAQTAERLQISRSLWSALENQQRPLTVALLNRIATTFELSDEDINRIRVWWGEAHSSLPSQVA
jgi:transcriptional regulator with XRE-family HTH domain